MFMTSSQSVRLITPPDGVTAAGLSLPPNTPASQSTITTAINVTAAMAAMMIAFLPAPAFFAGFSGRAGLWPAVCAAPPSRWGAPHLGQKAVPGLS